MVQLRSLGEFLLTQALSLPTLPQHLTDSHFGPAVD
jgi:hypothetical protein